jgi:hypothetical protein
MRAIGSGPGKKNIRVDITVDSRQGRSGKTCLTPEDDLFSDGEIRRFDELDVQGMVGISTRPGEDNGSVWRSPARVDKRDRRAPE